MRINNICMNKPQWFSIQSFGVSTKKCSNCWFLNVNWEPDDNSVVVLRVRCDDNSVVVLLVRCDDSLLDTPVTRYLVLRATIFNVVFLVYG